MFAIMVAAVHMALHCTRHLISKARLCSWVRKWEKSNKKKSVNAQLNASSVIGLRALFSYVGSTVKRGIVTDPLAEPNNTLTPDER